MCAVNGSSDDGQQEAEETTQTAGDEGEDEGRNVDEAPSNEATGQGEPAADSTKDAAEAPEAPDDAEGPAGVTVRAGLNNYAWDELKAISQSMAASGSKQAAIGIASSYNLCGPSGDLTAMGSKEAVLADGSVHHVRVVGILQDQTADGGLAGLSFLFDEAVSFHSWNSSDFNDSGWESSNLRTFVLNDLAARHLIADCPRREADEQLWRNGLGHVAHLRVHEHRGPALGAVVCGACRQLGRERAVGTRIRNRGIYVVQPHRRLGGHPVRPVLPARHNCLSAQPVPRAPL